jgi:glycosyltransferase involved in cell wall biosynthesis
MADPGRPDEIMTEISVSVIIPTHNRRSDLHRLLAALVRQTFPSDRFEAIVVSDGCTDGTQEMVREFKTDFRLSLVDQSPQGAAAARNRGAKESKGRLLLFLDDDVEPAATLVEVHHGAHPAEEPRAVVGPYPPDIPEIGFLDSALRGWWNRLFEKIGRPGYRHGYTSLLTGNLSIPARLFKSLGEFDPALRAHEDYEFGIRIMKAGVRLRLEKEAVARHHVHSDLRAAFRRRRDEGVADVLIAERHPEAIPTLPLAGFAIPGSPAGWLVRILRIGRFPADPIAERITPILALLERAGLRRSWDRLRKSLSEYWYWRGVAETISSRPDVRDLIRRSGPSLPSSGSAIEIDLKQGLEAAERRLDAEKAMSVRLRYGRHPIGVIPHRPFAEPLRGEHLRPFLERESAVPLLEALALEGVIREASFEERRDLARSIRESSRWFGPGDPAQIGREQFAQWERFKRAESVRP